MTRTKKDYSTTYVYEIACKNLAFPVKYLGYTTNFKQCVYNYRCAYKRGDVGIYLTMAANGGFDNWSITVIHKYCCQDGEEARRMLDNHPGYVVLDIHKSQVFSCDVCEYICSRKSHIDAHNKTAKHISMTTTDIKIQTPDHGQTSELTGLVLSLLKQNQEQQEHHKVHIVELMKSNQEQMTELIKSNQQLQSQMIEVCSRPTMQVNNTKNAFNLNIFLNEECKDAMTLDDFLEKLVLTAEEILGQANTTYEEGFAAIFKNRFCDTMSVYERPIHCTDGKREVVFYKDRERKEWVKDDTNSLPRDLCQAATKQAGKYIVKHYDNIPRKVFDDVMSNIVPANEKQRAKMLRSLIPHLSVPK